MDVRISDVVSLRGKAAPFLLFRLAIAFAAVVVVVLGAGIGAALGSLGHAPGAGAAWGGLTGVALASGAVFLLRERFVQSSVLFAIDRLLKGILRAFKPTALVLYAQSYKAFLTNALWMWGLTILVFLAVLAPAPAVASLLGGIPGVMTVVVTLVLAWGLKQAVIEPVGMGALLLVFFNVPADQTPNPAWEERLASLSGKFGELTAKARGWRRPEPGPTPA